MTHVNNMCHFCYFHKHLQNYVNVIEYKLVQSLANPTMYISQQRHQRKNNFYGREQSMTLTLEGITISIEPDLERLTYRVEVDIPQAAMQEQVSIRKGKDVQLEFHKLQPFKSRDLKLKFQGRYQKDKKGRFIVSEYATFEVKNNEFFEFYLKLRPKLYVPFQLTQRNKGMKKREKKKKNSIPTVTIGRCRPSAAKQINYKYNNVARPWQGGMVTPK